MKTQVLAAICVTDENGNNDKVESAIRETENNIVEANPCYNLCKRWEYWTRCKFLISLSEIHTSSSD